MIKFYKKSGELQNLIDRLKDFKCPICEKYVQLELDMYKCFCGGISITEELLKYSVEQHTQESLLETLFLKVYRTGSL